MSDPGSRTPFLFPPRRRVKVLLPLPLAGAYDYALEEGAEVRPGQFVEVPLGPRLVYGCVWSAPAIPDEADTDAVPDEKLKPISRVLDAPPLSAAGRDFVDWVSAYTMAAPGAVLRMAMSAPKALEPERPQLGYAIAEEVPELRVTKARARVMEVARGMPPLLAADLAREAGVSPGVVKGLADAGALLPVPIRTRHDIPEPDTGTARPELSPDQAAAAEALVGAVRAGEFSVTLLDGVTGSGKTEVYFEMIAEALDRSESEGGSQVLVMLPEIALSAQWLARFEARFGAQPVEWHSDLTPARRRLNWRAVAEGKARVVVGARSALHLPYPDLGLIVVDEEHDGSFKQEDGVIYHARDMAVVRARIGDFPIVLSSATPSLETLANAEAGRYRHLKLHERHGEAELPEIRVVDLRKEPPPRQRWISPPLEDALRETVEKGEQAMLFLNRRGYAPLTLCRTCGHRIACPNCDAWMVEHRFGNRLECHHCGHSQRTPDTCPECGDEGSLAACGPGVERLAEEAASLFPEARLEVATSDTMQGPVAAADFVERMNAGEIDILVGTQIVAKGYHFPQLTLVGIVDADLGLAGGDLRAAERTFQLLNQVAGRAGRAGHPGRVFLQTANPDAAVLHAIAEGDRDGFMEEETRLRRDGVWPPFGRLAAVVISGEDQRQVEEVADRLARAAPNEEGIRVLGPASPPLALLRGRHRRRFLMKTGRNVAIQRALADWLGRVKLPNAVRAQVDIDPYNFM